MDGRGLGAGIGLSVSEGGDSLMRMRMLRRDSAVAIAR